MVVDEQHAKTAVWKSMDLNSGFLSHLGETNIKIFGELGCRGEGSD
jgi:hypothetical protein